MTTRRTGQLLAITLVGFCWSQPLRAADEALPDSDALLRALVDELDRSMNLRLEDLEKPYFIQFDVDDTLSYQLTASYGALTGSSRNRSRNLTTRVRVGSAELDNTNFAESGGGGMGGGGGGGRTRASLPIDDDYLALRQVIWRAADADYKNAIETLTRKRAYMKDKNIADRPNDFSPAPKVEQRDPPAVLHYDADTWTANLRRISAHFKQYPQVQDSNVRLLVSAGNSYLVNSEGTRLRTADTKALLFITAQVQAADGMRLSDGRRYVADTAADLPPIETILRDIDSLITELTAAAGGSVLEHYSGPILFDGVSAAQMLQTVLLPGLVGKPDPVGTPRRGAGGGESLESKLGTRILPKTMQVWDDPTVAKQDSQALLGTYRFDDEGVAAARVNIVTGGKLEQLCLSRAPTKKLSGSNGHARRVGSSPEAAVGCLFVQDSAGLPSAELKAALIAAAKDAGLEYGVRVVSLRVPGLSTTASDVISMMSRRQRGAPTSTPNEPVIAFKVFVADGHEEPFRGAEFGSIEVSALKRIAAVGDTPSVHNYVSGGIGSAMPPGSIVAPPLLVEELELSQSQQETDKTPLLPAPAQR